MALPSNDLGLDYSEHLDREWLCAVCLKPMSQPHLIALSLDNCTCSKTREPSNPDHAGRPNGLGVNVSNISIDQRRPVSYPASDDGSIKTPDGPEARDPDKQYLPLAPDIGLGEVEHRRRASLDEVEVQISYSVRRYLKTLRLQERALQSGLENGSNGWLRQDAHLVAPTESVQAVWGYDSRSGSTTMGSEHSGSSGLKSWNIDPVVEAGAWVEGDDNCYAREIDDNAFDEDDAEGDMRRT